MTIVTLLTDFGTKDSYVAQMKGVILSNCPDCLIIDITHDTPRHNITQGSFLLETAVSNFPAGSVHVGVVDPGVGGNRLPVVVKCKRGVLIGPDNGLLVRAAARLGLVGAYRIQQNLLGKRSVFPTFHGRDVFAVAAGKIASGRRPEKAGSRISKLVELNISGAKVARGMAKCSVLHVDVFGNVITSLANENVSKFGVKIGDVLKVRSHVGGFRGRFVRTYADVELDELAVLKGSQGYLEVALREQNGARLLEVGPSDELEITLVR